MLIGVVADSHGSLAAIQAAIEALKGASVYIHAGDYYSDGLFLARKSGIRCYAVSGNCDIGPRGPKELVIELGGKRIYLTHGHLHGVKYGLERLIDSGLKRMADVVIFGHTHVPMVDKSGGMLLFNPGSVSLGRSSSGNTVGLLDIKDGVVEPRIIQVGSHG